MAKTSNLLLFFVSDPQLSKDLANFARFKRRRGEAIHRYSGIVVFLS